MKKTRPQPTASPERRKRAIQYALVFLGLVLFAHALVGDKGLFAMLRARQEYRQLEASLAGIRARNAALRDQARRLREDPGAIEEVARGELGLIKEGEKVYILHEPPNNDLAAGK